MEGLSLENMPEAIGDLVELRYLGLRYAKLIKLRSWLSRLKNLVVLDLKTLDFFLKVEEDLDLLKLVNLRHLYLWRELSEPHVKFQVPKNLQTLKSLSEERWLRLEHVPQMTSIRKLGIEVHYKSLDIHNLCSSLALLENLVCLTLRIWPISTLSSIEELCSLRHVTKLKLQGDLIGLPCPNDFPPNLSYLIMEDSFLHEDPMPVLEKLTKLQYLRLNFACDKKEMVISHNGFPSLQVLRLMDMKGLRNIQLEDGGMPELKRLEIHDCRNLVEESLPEKLRLVMTRTD